MASRNEVESDPTDGPELARRLHALASLGVLVIGSLVLVGGWALGIDRLTSWAPNSATMKPDTAVGLLLCGLSLGCRLHESPARLRLARTAAAAAVLLAAATLAQRLGGWSFGLQELLLRDPGTPTLPFGARMSLATAVSFVLMGLALVWLDHRAAEALIGLSLVLPAVSLAALAYNSDELMMPLSSSAMALPTALSFMLLGTGALSARPRRGVAGLIASQGTDGVLARRTMLGATAVIAGVGAAAQLGYGAGLYGSDTRAALGLVGTLLGMIALLLWGAMKAASIETERLRGIEALRHSEERLRVLSDNLPDSAVYQYTRGADGRPRMLYISAGVERLTGVTAQQVLDRAGALFRQVLPGWSERYLEAEARSARELSDFDLELPMRGTDGEVRWMRLKSRPRRLPGGQVVWDGVQTDITQRRAANEALRASEQRLWLFLESAPAALAIFDTTMRYLAASRRWLQDYGVDANLVGQMHYEVFPDLPRQWKAAHRRALAGEIVKSDGDRVERPDGTVQWVKWDAQPWRTTSGEIGGIIIASEDITAHKRAEERFQQVVEGAPNAMVMVDRDGRIALVNAETERMFGYPRNELLGRPLELLLPQRARADHPVLRQGYFRSPGKRAMGLGRDLRGLRKDGTEVPIEVSLNPLETAEGSFVLAAVVDVTERQRLQDELRAANAELERRVEQRTRELADKAQQLERASRVKSEFLANMSHELRTPLNSLLILSQMLADNAELNLSERQVTYAHTIHGAGQDLLQLIDDILDLAKVEAGKLRLFFEPVTIAALRDDIERTFRHQAEQRGLTFEIAFDPALPPRIETDPKRLRQIVKNLLANAIKFTERGVVRLEMAPVDTGWPAGQLTLDRATRVIALAVTDSGIGIEPEQQSIIFEAFRQADGGTARQYGGTGLGLAISRELAQLLGCALTVQSTPGVGSRFTLWLPVAHEGSQPLLPEVGQPPVEAPPDRAGPPRAMALPGTATPAPARPADATGNATRGLAGKTVLLVDDDMRNLFALTGLLERQGLAVVVAESGREALDQLAAHPGIDLVLMDIMMPGMDGYQAMGAIRANPRYAQLPVIALTANAMKGDREKCLAAGANDYLSKPVEPDRLLQLLCIRLDR